MSFEFIEDSLSLFQQTYYDFIDQLVTIKNEGNAFTLCIIAAIMLLLTVQFVRYVYGYLFETQPIEDLLHFKAAPAGDRAAVISIQGQRKYMEDTYQAIPHLSGHSDWSYYGVYDGHGGARCSVYVAHYLHKHVLAWIDAYISHYSSNSQRLYQQLLSEKHTYHTISCDELPHINSTDGESATTDNTHTASNHNKDDTDIDNDNDIDADNEIENNHNDGNNNNNSNSSNAQNKHKGIPLCILKIMNEILLKSHRKADQEFLQLANRQRWKDGSTSVCCILLPAKDFIQSLLLQHEKPDDAHSKKLKNGHVTATKHKSNHADSGRDGERTSANNAESTDADKRHSNDSNEKEMKEKLEAIYRALLSDEHDQWLFVANTGDSRGILVSVTGEITEMTHDHKPNNTSERQRIQSDGGRVVFFGTWRVEGVLAVSRSFGDRLLKRWIIPDPEVMAHKINSKTDLFLILATDGVWDTVSNQEAARCAIECWNNPQQSHLSLNQRLRGIAQKITSFAYTRGSMDNITTLVVHLPSHCSHRV
mmetsp:Transcript_60980/g.96959  ORF Transcript_60980/g.96959 Transcript_60980/m.96959 type:complete len:535 (+) Transcript_60980:46-1650(+)